ncbi:hypothetical protein LR48_Vigan11g116500 [Vigna angularis]|uniref:Uncharacterized protein n=1 Tax=Phaseolus angularis TaxID=3914 RepID=A0A0L9VSS6_PHAAN|nr:hypothetical protein LR48_Vigan11g116500 [Vigna angularis]
MQNHHSFNPLQARVKAPTTTNSLLKPCQHTPSALHFILASSSRAFLSLEGSSSRAIRFITGVSTEQTIDLRVFLNLFIDLVCSLSVSRSLSRSSHSAASFFVGEASRRSGSCSRNFNPPLLGASSINITLGSFLTPKV